MQDKYIIVIKARKDIFGHECEEFRYAGIIIGMCTLNNKVEWKFSVNDAATFSSVEDAETWFLKNKNKLFTDNNKRYDFDMSSINIVKQEYSVVKTLEA